MHFFPFKSTRALAFISFLCLNAFFLDSYSASISVVQLFNNKQITLKAQGKGGFSGKVLDVDIKNISKQRIEGIIEAGTIFVSSDAGAQNLIVLENYPFVLGSNENTIISVFTNCIEPHDYSPYKGTVFTLAQNPSEDLSGLGKIIGQNTAYLEYSQTLLWSVARKEKSYTYTADDSLKIWPLYAYLSQKATVTKYKLPDPPKPKFVYTTRVNLIYNLDNDQKLTLKKFDGNGKLIREYYKDKVVPTGLYVVTLGHNEMVEDTAQRIVFKLMDEAGQVLMTKMGRNNQLEDKPKVWLLKTTIEYGVKEPVQAASLKLYDPEDNLITVLYQNKNLVAGQRRSPYSFFHGFGKNAVFKVKLFDSKGGVLQEISLSSANSTEVVK